jgi:hypothetical protein
VPNNHNNNANPYNQQNPYKRPDPIALVSKDKENIYNMGKPNAPVKNNSGNRPGSSRDQPVKK